MVIVKHKETNKKYVLLGTGYGMFKSQGAAGILTPIRQEGTEKVVVMTDNTGEIIYSRSTNLSVISIDGIAVEELQLNDPYDGY